MPTARPKLVVTVNSTGRQASSFIRVASAVGWHVRAQARDLKGLVAEELSNLPNVNFVVGELSDSNLVSGLFQGAQMAFINTTHWGDEIAIGKALADAAKRAGIKHYVYSSMPDHSSFGQGWTALPLWAQKYQVENYVRELAIPATFVYAGIYNNNFTSLPYPLFRMELQADRSFVWRAPFHPDEPLPWLDVEHDFGPALLQVFKEGPKRWAGHRIPFTFEVLTPAAVCEAFSRALSRPVTYERSPITTPVPVPRGYGEHLKALEKTLGDAQAPYFGPTMYFPEEAIELWEGNRGIEAYARDAFILEERANGLTWMDEDDDTDRSDGQDTPNGEGSKDGSAPGTPNRTKKYTGSC